MMGVCAFCKDAKFKGDMFEMHHVSDGIEMACSLKCLTLYDEIPKISETTLNEENAVECILPPDEDPVDSQETTDATNEHVTLSFSMPEKLSAAYQFLVICIEILQNMLKKIVSKSVEIVKEEDQAEQDYQSPGEIASHPNNDGERTSISPQIGANLGKRMYEEVDKDDSHTDDDLSKKVKENEIVAESTEFLLNFITDEPLFVDASTSDGELQLTIEFDPIVWNADTHFDAKDGNGCAAENTSAEKRTKFVLFIYTIEFIEFIVSL